MPSRIVWAALVSIGCFALLGQAEELRVRIGEPLGGRPSAGLPGQVEAPVTCAEEPLPADAQALLTVFTSESKAIRQKAEQEIQARRQTLIVALQALQDVYTREAKLDEAVAIRDAIRQLKGAQLQALANPGSLSQFANRIGETFYFDVVGASSGSLWGTEVYTCDSDLATAAVHMGVLKPGRRGIVKVTIVKSPDTHQGSTRNGVTSYNWGSYSSSYTVEQPFSDRAPRPAAGPGTTP